MAKIYKNFEELVEQNRGLFNAVLKSGNLGILEAIWNARQAEIDDLKEKNNQIESKFNSLNDANTYHENEITVLEKQRELLFGEINSLKKKIDLLYMENKELRFRLEQSLQKYQNLESLNTRRKLENEQILGEKDFYIAKIQKLESDLNLVALNFEEYKDQVDHDANELNQVLENLVNDKNHLVTEMAKLERIIHAKSIEIENSKVNLERSDDLLLKTKNELKNKIIHIETLEAQLKRKENEVSHFAKCFIDFQNAVTGEIKDKAPKSAGPRQNQRQLDQ